MQKRYYGPQTELALKNFPFSKNPAPIEFIFAIAEVKKAAALAHNKVGELDKHVSQAIVDVCDEISHGKYNDQFITPGLQGGAGTSINMNVNEIIASRATELLKQKNIDREVHPNDHVNRSQSTNDVNPSAAKIAVIRLTKELMRCIDVLAASFHKKGDQYKNVAKLGRTHLQDAVPIRVGDEFFSYESSVLRDRRRIEMAVSFLYELNLGGTAVGNSINASAAYRREVYKELSKIIGFKVTPAANLISQTSSQTDFCAVSQAIVCLLVDLSKIASDIRLLASGPRGGLGEFKLLELQSGSSIMPGKINPILPESINQLYYLVSGHNMTIEHAAEGAQLELGVMLPIIVDRLILSLKLACDIIENFSVNCVDFIEINVPVVQRHLEQSTAYATLLTPVLGYDAVSSAVKESLKSGKTLREVVISRKLMTSKEFDACVHVT